MDRWDLSPKLVFVKKRWEDLRLKNKGLPKMGGFGSGDMLIKILVDTPQEVSAAEKELLNKLSQSASETPLIKEYKEKVQKLSKYTKS